MSLIVPDTGRDQFKNDARFLFTRRIDLFKALQEFGIFKGGLGLLIFVSNNGAELAYVPEFVGPVNQLIFSDRFKLLNYAIQSRGTLTRPPGRRNGTFIRAPAATGSDQKGVGRYFSIQSIFKHRVMRCF